jgi:hypothetical protein
MRLICVKTEAEYFRFPGLTLFRKIRSDLPVVPVCRRPLREVALPRQANQFAASSPHERSDMRESGNDEDPGCRYAHPGYTLMSASQLKRPNSCAAAE